MERQPVKFESLNLRALQMDKLDSNLNFTCLVLFSFAPIDRGRHASRFSSWTTKQPNLISTGLDRKSYYITTCMEKTHPSLFFL